MLSALSPTHRPNAATMHDVAAIISRFSRPEIEGFVDVAAIGLLDALDGDADREEDDHPGGNVEDEPEGHDWEAEHKRQVESLIDQTGER